MRLRNIAILRATLATCAVLLAPVTAQPADIGHGQQIFNAICAQCHIAGATPGPGPISLGAWKPEVVAIALDSVPEMALFAALLASRDIEDVAAYLGVRFGIPPPGAPPTADAIEYYHAAFDHYFVTTNADEIAKLDNGTFTGWSRTARSFKVFITAGTGLSPVCRFFSTAFPPKSSHFYTASPSECAAVMANRDWTFEGEVYYVGMPAVDGTCANGMVPVYRLYNNGQGGAPNHRFTTEPQVRTQMLNQNWVPEGQGIGVTMCVHG